MIIPRPHRSVLRPVAVAAIGLILLGTSCGKNGADPLADTVASVLQQQLRERGEVRVVVALRVPAVEEDQGTDLAELQRQIARTQDEVLDALPPGGYRDPHRLQSVPAMTLTVLTEAALRALGAHPKVAKVDLDVSGGGQGP